MPVNRISRRLALRLATAAMRMRELQLHSHSTALLPHCLPYTSMAKGGPFIPAVDLILVGALGIQE